MNKCGTYTPPFTRNNPNVWEAMQPNGRALVFEFDHDLAARAGSLGNVDRIYLMGEGPKVEVHTRTGSGLFIDEAIGVRSVGAECALHGGAHLGRER